MRGANFSKKLSIPVTPGTPYTVTIPAEAPGLTTFTNGQTSDGANVTFTGNGGVSVTANGGQGGGCVITTNSTAVAGNGGAGAVVSGLYDVEWSGGGGFKNTAGNSGSGGSAASDTQAGVTATTQSTGSNLVPRPGSDTDHNGGRGDTGKSAEGNGNGLATAPGGGGGGAKDNTADATTRIGANGRAGQIIISYSGGTVAKANNANNLNLGTSWVGGNAPGTTDNAKWDNTVTSANTTVLGTNLAWGSIVIADPAGLVTINAGNTLTNNGGIDMSAATADLTLNCDYVLGNGAVWNVAAGRTLTLNGAISGASGKNINMLGDGTNILSGTNTYAGNTALAANSTGYTLKLGASNVIPDGVGKGDVTIGFGCTLDLNGKSETINGLNGTSSGSLISLIDNTAAGTTSTFTVGVTQSVASTTFAGILQNTGAGSTLNFVKTGTGQLTLQKANTLTGSVTVNGGTLVVQNATPFNSISGLSIGGGSTLMFNTGSSTLPAAVTLTGNATFNIGGSGVGNVTFGGPIGGAGNILIQSAANTVGDGSVITLGAANTFTGNVTIDSNPSSTLNSMTVRLGVADALPTNTVVTLDGQNSSGVHFCDLDLNGNNQTLAGLTTVTRSGRLQRVYSSVDATLTISNSANYSFGGGLGNTAGSADALALVKSGAGTFTLSRANTYANGTIINGGTLLVNNTNNSGTGSGTVTINSGATLGGTGIIDGAVTNNAGGTLSPGVAGIGTLTLNSDLILSASSTNTFEVDGTASTNDAVVLNVGAVTYDGVLKIVPSGSFVNGQTFTLFSGAGATSASQFSSLVVNPSVSGTSFTFTNGVLTAVVVSVGPSGPGTITNSYSGGVLSLSWPAGQGWRLQAQTNSLSAGLKTNWAYVTDGSVSSTNIPVNSANPTVFYRLTYP